jgi:hypothetical protein
MQHYLCPAHFYYLFIINLDLSRNVLKIRGGEGDHFHGHGPVGPLGQTRRLAAAGRWWRLRLAARRSLVGWPGRARHAALATAVRAGTGRNFRILLVVEFS